MKPEQFFGFLKEFGLGTDLAEINKSGAKHTKEDLFKFLKTHIAVVNLDGENHLVTSFMQYLQRLEALRAENNKNKVVKMVNSRKLVKILAFSKENHVNTWDLIANRKLTIDTDSSGDSEWSLVVPLWINLIDMDEKRLQLFVKMSDEIIRMGKNSSTYGRKYR